MHTRHLLRFLPALMIIVAACGAAGTEPGTQAGGTRATVADVSVTPTSASLSVGQTTQLTATPYDKTGNVLSVTPSWTSSAPQIAAVSADGMVTAMGIGTAAITATVTGHQATAIVTVAPNSLDVTVDNQLIYSVIVRAGGTLLGTVSAQSSQRLTAPSLPAGSRVDWELVQPTVGGRPIGDPMAGSFAATGASTGTRRLVINNVIGSDYYFVPVINNLTSTDLLMAVNYQLQSENRCNCVVAAGRTSVAIGYYHLYSNSNVSAFRTAGNYSGSYRYFSDFGIGVGVGSGRQEFTFTIAP